MKRIMLAWCLLMFSIPSLQRLNAQSRSAVTAWIPSPQDVEAAIRNTPKRSVENLLQPVRTITYDGDDNLIWAPNPDGRTWDVIPIYFEGYGGRNTLSIVDLGSGEVKVENRPPGLNWHLPAYVVAPNGKVYIASRKRQRVAIHVYDPAQNELKREAIPTPEHMQGEMHPIVRSQDGMIFVGGGHASKAATCIMIDPRDDSITDFGSLGPSHAPTRCFNYYMGVDDTHVYIASGKVPWYLLAVDRKTKKSTTLAKTENTGGMVVVEQETHGVKARVFLGRGSKRQDYWLHQGKMIPKSAPCPWGKKGVDWQAALPPKPDIYTKNMVPTAAGQSAELWVKANVPQTDRDPKFPGWSRVAYDVPLYPMGSHRLTEMPDGRLLGTGGPYTGNYIYDPSTGKCSYTGKLHLSHYATAAHDNKIWMSGYPASRLYAFDYTKPLQAGGASAGPDTELALNDSLRGNPRFVGRLAESKCHKMYGAAVGASGDIYFGGIWMRTGNGGGLGWWNSVSNKEAGLWKPFSNHQIAYLCAADSGRHIVISTVRVGDLVLKKPTPKEGRLFVFDDSKKEIVREIIVENRVRGPGPIAWAGGNRIIGWTNDPANGRKSILYGVDLERGEVVWKKSLPFKLPVQIGSNQKVPWDFRRGPDGHIWTFMGREAKALVRINPEMATVEGVAHVNRGGRLAFSSSDIYLSGTTYLRRIRNVTKF